MQVNAPEDYRAAWRDRRRRMRVFKTIQIAFFPIIAGLADAALLFPSRALPRQALLVLLAWLIAYLAAGVWLNRFRCPRCGNLYYWRWQLKGALERQARWRDCHYCGLSQDAEPLKT